MPLSDNGKEVLNNFISVLRDKLGDWLAIAAAVLTLYIQSHNQHAERVEIARKANEEAAVAARENTDGLTKLAGEVKALQRPLVFGEKK